MKRIICALLCLALLSLCLCACDTTDAEESKGTASDTSGSTVQGIVDGINTATGLYDAGIDPDLRYEGREIVFLTCGPNQDHESEILFNVYENGETQSGAMSAHVNEGIRERNNLTEQQFGITIKEEYIYDSKRMNGDFFNRVRTDSMSDSVNYHVLVPCLYDGANLAAAGYLADLNSVESIHLEKPWWSQSINEECTINGKLYFQLSDIGYVSSGSVPAIAFNKKWVENYHLEDPYQLVRDGKWTLDKVIEMTKTHYEDLDGDGKTTYADVFGWAGQLDDMWSLFYGSGEKIASIGNDGLPYISIFNSRSASVVEKMQELSQDETYYVCANDYFHVVQWPSTLTMAAFVEGRCLFYNGSLSSTSDYARMKDDFGLLPIPKYDETQETYHSLANPWVSTCFCIPNRLSDEDIVMVGNILEYMGAVSKNEVEGNFINQVLQNQKTRDDESFEMIKDYILPYKGCDAGFIYKWGSLDSELLQKMRAAQPGSFASAYDALSDKAASDLADTIAAFSK